MTDDNNTKITVSENQNGQRLDHFLCELYPDISRSYLQKNLIQSNKVKVNHRLIHKKGHILEANDTVSILPFTHPGNRKIEANSNLDVQIIDEQEQFLIFNKPKGIPTHPNQYNDNQTLANFFVSQYPGCIEVGEDKLRPGVVHRLDTDTSGCIAFAKTQSAYTHFRSLFNERLMYKLYLAIVIGKTPSKGQIDYDVAHHQKNTRKMVNVTHDEMSYRGKRKNASTAYHCLDQNEEFSLLLLKTFTGRMHQVRIHLSGIGYPLIGDKVYQRRQDQHRDVNGEQKHCLHAYFLGFNSDIYGEKSVQAALPKYFLDLLDKTQLKSKAIDPKLLFLSIQEFLDSHPFANPDV